MLATPTSPDDIGPTSLSLDTSPNISSSAGSCIVQVLASTAGRPFPYHPISLILVSSDHIFPGLTSRQIGYFIARSRPVL
ncbi:hypothetical protein LB506_006833 [Fusarium annulatum]|nr:hypothetical protein LB506_006833 [Fusarium annulatum]